MVTAVTLVFGVALPLAAQELKPFKDLPPRALHEYVALKDDTFALRKIDHKGNDARHQLFELTSQKWQGIDWKHSLLVVTPEKLDHPEHVLLFITGGRTGGVPRDKDRLLADMIAGNCGARVAVLGQVPNQPLYGDKVEDDLITETFLRFNKTHDPTWPLLFPMAKSAVRAMDAVEKLAADEWKTKLKGFVVTGASKRGWTTWLSSAVDKRVVAIAPMVIDTLNFKAQMEHQKATWGYYSEQIEDYTSKGLVDLILEDKGDNPLFRWVDPYTYRKEIQVPKLLIHGANDRYWVLDAASKYWDGLEGPKAIHYAPNGGHDLGVANIPSAISSLGGFFRLSVSGETLPEVTWKTAVEGDELVLTVTAGRKPNAAVVQVASAEKKDFRESKWAGTPMTGSADGLTWTARVKKPATGHIACFGSLTFDCKAARPPCAPSHGWSEGTSPSRQTGGVSPRRQHQGAKVTKPGHPRTA
jgi:PhoPQ-activated pathogenicity-related protein